MALSKTNIAVLLVVGFVNYLEWAVVMTSIYPYILSVSISTSLIDLACNQFAEFACNDFVHPVKFKNVQIKPEMVFYVQKVVLSLSFLLARSFIMSSRKIFSEMR